MEIQARIKPKNVAPVSPIKVFAGLKLKGKNPKQAPVSASPIIATEYSPIRTAKVVNGVADFLYLAPGSYYARIIEDTNGNGEYDTGDYDTKRQPEFAYYYPKKINIKKNWEITQTWNVFETAIDLQKPEVLKKNKPEASKHGKKKQQNEEEEEDEESFDVNSNPFDPNSNRRSNNNRY